MNDAPRQPPRLEVTPPEQPRHRFVVAGIGLRAAFRKLKPAFPKKKNAGSTKVTISASGNKVTFALVGAAVGMPALTSGSFVAEIPFTELQFIVSDPYEDAELLTFELAPESLTIRGITTKSPEICVQPAGANAVQDAAQGDPPFGNPLDAPMDFPLLAAYAYIRRHGLQPAVASREFAQQQMEVDYLLDRAAKVLKPLGLSRRDIEGVLDKRLSP